MEREGDIPDSGNVFGEMLGHSFSLVLSLHMKHGEKGYIENKDVAKEENKWSSLGSGRKTINVMFYDTILQLRKLVETVKIL